MRMFRRLPAALAALPVALASSAAFIAADADVTTPQAFSPAEFRKFKLAKIEKLTHDTKRYTVALPESADTGMKVASLVMLQTDVEGKKLARPYTPVSPVHQRGTMDFIIKSYPAGKVSKALDELKEGEEVEIKGPYTKYEYAPNTWSHVGLLAGGTGITPMYQLIREIVSNPRDHTRVTLLYASRTPEDIILKAELDSLAAVYPNFRVIYTVDNSAGPSASKHDISGGAAKDHPAPVLSGWKGSVGVITKDMLESYLPPAAAGTDIKVMVCGPPGFYKAYSGEKKSPSDQGPLTGLLNDLGYTSEQVFKY